MEDFDGHLFRRCLHRHAVPLRPVLAWVDGEFFAADRELIARAGLARTMAELTEEIREYIGDARNQRWLRRGGRVRISTRRLWREARPFLEGKHLAP